MPEETTVSGNEFEKVMQKVNESHGINLAMRTALAKHIERDPNTENNLLRFLLNRFTAESSA